MEVISRVQPASMGPRLFSRGNARRCAPCRPSRMGRFNGATTFQPWKSKRWLSGLLVSHATLQWGHDFSAVEISMATDIAGFFIRFNGATTFQPWKYNAKLGGLDTAELLQWGHDFSAVEIPDQYSGTFARDTASMGPRLFSRGNRRRLS